MPSLIRDSALGSLIRRLPVTAPLWLTHVEDQQGYLLPRRYHQRPSPSTPTSPRSSGSSTTTTTYITVCNAASIALEPAPQLAMPSQEEGVDEVDEKETDAFPFSQGTAATSEASTSGCHTPATLIDDAATASKDRLTIKLQQQDSNSEDQDGYRIDPFLVDFEKDDVDDPYNWPDRKRYIFTSLISLLTFSVYIGSAIFTASIPGLVAETGILPIEGTLGLSLFVLGYGVGPLFLAPLQETPAIGRTPVYIITLLMFVIFNIGAVFVNNLPGLLILRLLSGFVGSPALATGGASIGDVWNPRGVPYAIGLWSMGAVFGPTLGPVFGGYAAEALGYRWPIIELSILSGASLIILFFLLPETLASTLLLQRAQRLRRVTGDERYRAQSELVNEGKTILQEIRHNFVYTIKLSTEPVVLFSNVYIGLVYSVFYLWFEAFPLVFTDIYHFGLGASGLPFLGFVVTGLAAYALYAGYQYYHMQPALDRDPATPLEKRLELALYTSWMIPLSLLIFGWTSRESVHWIFPVIGAAIYLPPIFLAFQCILIYVVDGYPGYAASILAGNDFYRSTSASIFPLFGTIFFVKVGLGPACTILAAISTVLIVALYYLIQYGPHLRARSKYSSKSTLQEKDVSLDL